MDSWQAQGRYVSPPVSQKRTGTLPLRPGTKQCTHTHRPVGRASGATQVTTDATAIGVLKTLLKRRKNLVWRRSNRRLF